MEIRKLKSDIVKAEDVYKKQIEIMNQEIVEKLLETETKSDHVE